MIGELQIVLHLHAVTIVLGVLSQLLVLVEQLRRIAPCATVNAVLVVATALIVAVSAPAAPIVVAIVIQGKSSL